MSVSRRDPASKLARELLEGDFRPAPLPADGIAQPAGGWEECCLPLDEPLFRRLEHLERSDAFMPAALMMVSYALLFSLYSGQDSAVVCLPVSGREGSRPVAVRVPAGSQRRLEELTQSTLQKLHRLAQAGQEAWEGLDPRLYRFALDMPDRLSFASPAGPNSGQGPGGNPTSGPWDGADAADRSLSPKERRVDGPSPSQSGQGGAGSPIHGSLRGVGPDGPSPGVCSGLLSSGLDGWDEQYPEMGLTARLTADGRLVQRNRAGLISPPWARQMGRYALRILSLAVREPGLRVGDIELAPPAVAVSARAGALAPRSPLAQFGQICRSMPQHIALCEGERSVSYGQLWQYVQALSRRLSLCGVQTGQTVAVLAGRSMEAACAMLAVFAAGGVYLPVDRSLPAGRVRAILDDSRPAAVLCASGLEQRLPPGLPVLPIEWQEGSLPAAGTYPSPGDGSIAETLAPQSPAYLIYTSGSTGRPKGVLLPWEGIARLGDFFRQELGIGPGDVVGQFASLSFDASVWEMLMAFLTGAKLVILPEQSRTDPRLFTRQAAQYGVSVLTLPPHFASLLEPSDLPTLRRMITAGSSPSAALAGRWSRRMDYFNAYGPTETSVCCTVCGYPKGSAPALRITAGHPIGDYTIHIAGPDGRARPPYLPGEIVVEGDGVALEYLHDTQRSEQKIRTGQPGKRRYYTGDIGRLVEGGRLEILGRGDAQLKLRGYRIEPEEIRQTLLSLGLAGDAAVVAKPDRSGDERLCAYLAAPRTVDKGELDRRLGELLPAYMLPDHYQSIDAIPLSPSGKVDAAALPNPWVGPKPAVPSPCGKTAPTPGQDSPAPGQQHADARAAGGRPDSPPLPEGDADPCHPSKKTEENSCAVSPPQTGEILPRLKALWAELLEVEDIAPQDEFFRLGGQSLKAIRLRAKIEEAFCIRLDIKEIYAHPSLQGMAGRIASRLHHRTPGQPYAHH